MKVIGIVLVVAGILLAIFAFNMNVTVSTDSVSIGGSYIPSQQVNNAGLMSERQNYLLVAGVLFLAGLVLMVADTLRKPGAAQESSGDTRKCPQCAEYIKAEARVCRYCGNDMTPVLEAETAAEERRLLDQEAQEWQQRKAREERRT